MFSKKEKKPITKIRFITEFDLPEENQIKTEAELTELTRNLCAGVSTYAKDHKIQYKIIPT